MKLKSILLLICLLLGSAFSLNYYANDPADGLEVVKMRLREAGDPSAGNVLLVKTDSNGELAFQNVSCTNKTALKNALKADLSEQGQGQSQQLRRGPCCINPHHVVCQVELENIRNTCDHAGKGSNTTGCPA